MPNMKETYKAYIAGIFDGEGCLTISKTYRADTREDYWPVVQIGWVNIPRQKEVLEELKSEFGGYFAEYGITNTRHRPVCFWRVSSQKAAKFAKLLLPYLVVKKKHAEIIIEFSKLQASNRKRGARWDTEKAIQRKQELVKEIRILNKRGTDNTVND